MCLSNRTMVQKECPEGHQFDAESVVRIKYTIRIFRSVAKCNLPASILLLLLLLLLLSFNVVLQQRRRASRPTNLVI